MTTFDDRERAAEAHFALDETQRFNATARRNRLVGLWAAGKLGKTGADADAYARTVVISDLEESGEEDVFRKLRADLALDLATDVEIRAAMQETMGRALAAVRTGA